MAPQPFDLGRVPATPWKNGGGTTRELACWPPGADMAHFDWRVSVATIAQSGPFSCFAGVDRVITLLSGDGVRLRQAAAGIDHSLQQPLQPFAFAGDGGMDCDLLGGTSTDFNLMMRRGRWQGTVKVLSGQAVLPLQPAGLLLAVRGSWVLTPLAAATGAAQAHVLAPDAGLWWADEVCGWHAQPNRAGSNSGSGSGHGGVLLHVQLVPV